MHPNYPVLTPGIKLCAKVEPLVTETYCTFLEQMGIRYAYTWIAPEQFTKAFIMGLKERLARHGITLFNVGSVHIAKNEDIILAKPGRDAAIAHFIDCLKVLSESGIHTTTITWEPDGCWASDWDYPTRGGALTRACDMGVFTEDGRRTADTRYTQIPIDRDAFVKTGLTHGRIYTAKEMWDSFTYFIRKVIPYAEEYGVRIALHPNDPPVESMGGVACLIKSYDDYRRAYSICDSPFLGMEFCCGCCLETPDTFGDILEAIREFTARRKIFLVHFRNVRGKLPCFEETFIDEGSTDMLPIMQAFVKCGYDGTLIMDHTPRMIPEGGGYPETAYAYGYIRALLQVAEGSAGR